MDRISAVIITKNEARNVERCLRSLAPVADEVVVVDDFSEDGTAAICERHGARVLAHRWEGFGPQKNLGNEAATNEWVLSIDADEELDEPLQRAVVAAKAAGLRGAYVLSRLNYYYGKFLRHGLEYPDRKVRLFRRSAARWDDSLVHESLRFSEAPALVRLDGHLLHYTYLRLEEHAAKADRYTTLAARDAFRRGVRPSLLRIVVGPLVTFLRSYVLKRGFLDGAHGLVLAVMHAHGALLKHAKLWDLHRRGDVEQLPGDGRRDASAEDR